MHRQSYRQKNRGGIQLHRFKEESWGIDNVSLLSLKTDVIQHGCSGFFHSFSDLQVTCSCSNPRAGNVLQLVHAHLANWVRRGRCASTKCFRKHSRQAKQRRQWWQNLPFLARLKSNCCSWQQQPRLNQTQVQNQPAWRSVFTSALFWL